VSCDMNIGTGVLWVRNDALVDGASRLYFLSGPPGGYIELDM
jgi:hypothetical protein